MKHFSRTAAIAVLIAAMMLSLFGLSSCRKKPVTPMEYLSSAYDKTLENKIQSPLYIPALLDAEGYGLDVAFKSTEDTAFLGVDRVSLEGVLTKNALSASGEVKIGENEFDASVFLNDALLAIGSDAILGGTYGAEFKNLKEKYENSIFADSDSDYYIPGDISSILETISDGFSSAVSINDIQKIVDKYVALIKDVLHENEYAKSETDKEGTTVTVSLNNAAVEKLLRKVFNTAKEDEELRSLFEKLIGLGSMSGEIDADEIMEEYDAFLSDSDTLDELISEMNENASFKLTLTVKTDKKDIIQTAKLVFDATIDGTNGKIILALDLSEKDAITLKLTMEGPEDGEVPFDSATLRYRVTENSKSAYASKLTLTVDQDGEKTDSELYAFSYEKSSGEFKLTLGRGFLDDNAIVVRGELTTGKKTISVKITKISSPLLASYLGENSLSLDLKVVLTADAKEPNAPKYKNIFDLTESEMEALVEKSSSAFEDLD